MKKIIYTLSMAFCLMATLISCKEKDMSMKMNEPRNIKGVISYKRSFGDLNDTHMAAAKKSINNKNLSLNLHSNITIREYLIKLNDRKTYSFRGH